MKLIVVTINKNDKIKQTKRNMNDNTTNSKRANRYYKLIPNKVIRLCF